ncbi:MAG: FixH family protein [Rhodobacteraceae bacterium]|nr:FixH family protein [Paracoccaceae bacterium]
MTTTTDNRKAGARRLTGRGVLMITLGFFGTIIVVNLFMAYSALSTFPGLEVRNSYVASQGFDARRDAQTRLGWNVVHSYEGGRLSLAVTDETGAASRNVADMTAVIGRPTHGREDTVLTFPERHSSAAIALDLDPGVWIIKLAGEATDGTRFEQRLSFSVRN